MGGWSLTVAGDISATYHLLRLNNDGSLDISYTKLSTPNGLVTSIKILNDDAGNPNRAEVLGSMPNISGNHTGYLVTLFNTGAVQSYIGDETFNGLVSGYARDNLNRLVYTGLFTKALGVDRPNVARFNSNGTLDNSFNPGTGPNGEVTHLVIQSDNKVVLAGNFNRFSGHTVGYMARLNENGTFDSSFSGSADDRIFRLEAGGTNLLVVGSFRSVNNTTRNGAALLDVNGNLSGNYASLTNDNSKPAYVYAVMTQSDGKVLVGGDFTGMQGKFHRGIARLNYDGSLDQTFTASVDGYIRTIALQNDGRILLGGSFGACSGYPRASLVRIDPNIYPSVDDAFNPVITKLDGSVSELYRIVPVNDQIMVAGHFRKINLVNQSIAARFFSNGTVDAGFNAQITITNSSTMWATDLIPTKDGKYMICGYVTYESLGRGWLTRLTGTGAMDTTFTPTTPSPNVVITAGQVRDMLLQPDGKSVIVGDFSEIIDGSLFNRPQRGGIARFNVNGALDNTLTTDIGANHWVTCIVLQSSGKFIIGGYFTKYNVPNYGDPDNAHRLAQVNSNGSFSPTFKAIPGADNALSVITLTSGGRKAYIGGQFTTYDGVVRNGIARIITNRSGATPVYYLLLN